MPQWRKLHTKILQSVDIHEMPDDFTRLVWTYLPLILDREGRCPDNVSLVKSRVMPMREDVTPERMGLALDWFAGRGMIVRYSVNGRSYFYVPTFRQYQGDTRKETGSVLPAPVDDVPSTVPGTVPSQELVESRSSTDSDSDADADTTTTPPAAVVGVTATEKEQEGARKTGRVFDAWQKLNPRRQSTEIDGEKLNDMISQYGADDVLKAIYIANEQGHPTLAYMGGILKNNGQPRIRASPGPPAPVEFETRMITIFNPVSGKHENVEQLIPKQKPNS